jgi:hypothetical protein
MLWKMRDARTPLDVSLLPALLSIIFTVVTTLLELFGLEEEEEDGSPRLSVTTQKL